MKCLCYDRNGPAAGSVILRDMPEPVAGAGEAIVQLEASPVHIADLMAIEGRLDFIAKGPGVPGFEGVGHIVALGDNVEGWSVGDRVILPMAYGAWQERRTLCVKDLWRAPAEAAPEQLALVRINLTTAYLLLHSYCDLRKGDWIVQNAANSNVAGYVTQLAQGRGIGVVNLVRREDAAAELREAGARHVLLDTPAAPDLVREQIGVVPRLALDAIGGDATARLGNMVANNGLVLAYGFLARERYQLDYPDAMFRNVRLEAMMTDRALHRIGAVGQAKMARDIESFMASGALNARIAATYAFEDAAAALAHADRTGNERAGKVLFRP